MKIEQGYLMIPIVTAYAFINRIGTVVYNKPNYLFVDWKSNTVYLVVGLFIMFSVLSHYLVCLGLKSLK